MYVKLLSPQKAGFKAYDNTGSVSQVSNYLDKEERQYLKAAEKGKLNSNDIANSYDNSSRTANYLERVNLIAMILLTATIIAAVQLTI